MPGKIPTTVITGFLGAGKTTLIRNLLSRANGHRIALVINEFGDIGVDGEVLRGCGDTACREDDIVELSNGCICCTVADDFIPTMSKLISRSDPPDHIVIETSGLALPQPLVRAFNWPEIRTSVTVDGVVTVVDGPAIAEGRFAHDPAAVEARRLADESLDHQTPLAELFEDQVACADLIVVSKTDLMEEQTADAVFTRLADQSRRGVRVIRSASDGLAPEVLLGLGIGAEADIQNRAGHHDHDHDHDLDDDHDDDDHDHDEFESFAVTMGEIDDPDGFLAALAETLSDRGILRLKGFAAIRGKPMRMVIQAVGPRIDTYFDRPFGSEPRETRLVVIGLAPMDPAAIRSALGA